VCSVQSQWVPPLEELVERINGSFSKYFEAIGCAGKIQLGTSLHPHSHNLLAIPEM
jgi:hypothetical protein